MEFLIRFGDSVDRLSRQPAGVGKLGAMIVLFYFALFFLIGLVRGKLWPRKGADGNYHLLDWLTQFASVELVPLVFLGLGLVPFFANATCIQQEDYFYEARCSRYDECYDCPAITAYGADRSDIRWIASLGNAYGYGVVVFQPYVAGALALAVLIGILWCLWRLVRLLFRALRSPAAFLMRQLKRIPIRI